MPAKVYTDKDADLGVFKNKTLAILGYGSQGHAHALNLKESGCKVIIGLYPGSKSRAVAEQHGLKVYDTAEAVRRADVIMVGLPDMKQADVYKQDIAPNLTKGKTLLFSHGLAIHFGLIKTPKGVDVIMVAPKGPGHMVRRLYVEGKGMPALIAVAPRQFQAGQGQRARLGQGHRLDQGRRAPDHLQGRVRDRPLRRAGRALRRRFRAGAGRL
jgi:ketol-acid reductoisomerase